MGGCLDAIQMTGLAPVRDRGHVHVQGRGRGLGHIIRGDIRGEGCESHAEGREIRVPGQRDEEALGEREEEGIQLGEVQHDLGPTRSIIQAR